MPAHFFSQTDLNPTAWDACVQASETAVPYGTYAWLRAVANGRFSALVWMDDAGRYQAVFPLPEKRKALLVPYLAMPPFTQRLGLFAQPGQDKLRLAAEAARALSRRYLRADLAVGDEAVAYTLSDRVTPFSNLILNLDRPIEELEAALGKSIRQKRKDAQRADLAVKQSLTALSAFSFIRSQLAPRLPDWDKWYDYAWGRLCVVPGAPFTLTGKLVYEADEVVAAAVFVQYGSRTIYLAGASNAAGLAAGAMAHLLWQEIELRAGQAGAVLDFEGGSMGGTRQFFSMFGAEPEIYWGLRMGI